MKIAMIYGSWCSQLHPPFNVTDIFGAQGLTGSESSFFNVARGLAARGHEVVIFCETSVDEEQDLDGCAVLPIRLINKISRLPLDAAISWNEPQYLRDVPPDALRICAQQLNDFSYCQDSCDVPQIWVCPSQHHLEYLSREQGLPGARAVVIPNSVDLSLFEGVVLKRDPFRVVWCSSPDRGLHHLLSFWPEIKARVPAANLHVFYRLAPWLGQMRDEAFPTVLENARRARFIEEAMARLGDPKWEVTFHDSVPNRQMAHELRSAAVLAYPCDPMRYTEGFGVSVLDACAADCQPIISDADALPSVHNAACVIKGRPGEQRETWINAICSWLGNSPVVHASHLSSWATVHAANHSHTEIAGQWEQLILERKAR